MKKSDIVKKPEYFDRYINLVDDIDIVDALDRYGAKYLLAEKQNFVQLDDKVYESGKWNIKDIIQHLIDAERVFSYRAMRFARNDKTALPGFDENIYAVTAAASNRSLDDLLEEFAALRSATTRLYKSFTKEMLTREGISFNKDISVV